MMEKKDVQGLQLSCEEIKEEVKQETVKGSFTIESKSGKTINGFVCCQDIQLEISPVRFQGDKVEVQFTFDGSRLHPGERVTGTFSVITNCGEKEISYSFFKEKIRLESSLGEIRNLFHFANLARTNWEEAVKLFFKPEFSGILPSVHGEERELYRGLKGTGKEQCVEEFLLAIRKKTPVNYRAEQPRLLFQNVQENRKEELVIYKEGWGFTNLCLKQEGGFFKLEKKNLTETDFLGNCCRVPVYLLADRLHQGKNYGQIILEHPYGSIAVQLEIHQNQHHRMKVAIEKRRNLKQMKIQLTELYVDFRAKRIATSRWRKETEHLLEKMRLMDERNPVNKLFTAHLYISTDKRLEAKWLLDRVEKFMQEDKDPAAYAYYLYLTTLLREDEEYHLFVKNKVEELHYGKRSSWQIAWLMLYLSHELRSSAQKKWEFLLEIFHLGCTSPVLYTEAVMLLNYQPTLLMELGTVEQRILHFGQRHGMLSGEVKGVLQYLSLKEKEYSQGLFHLLESVCLAENNLPMLQSLCSLLIKGDRKGKRYFPWYEKAVCEGLKITRLYEYYMMSLDRGKKQDIPRMVLLYFSYESSLSYPNAAYLYRYVYENRESMEELYLTYAPKIERFLLKQLHSGKINADLAYLYEHILVPDMLTEDNAAALGRLLFIRFFSAKSDRDEHLIVIHRHLEEESHYDFHQGMTKVVLMGRNYLLFREDSEGQRFLIPREEYPKAFFSLSALTEKVGGRIPRELGAALYLCEEQGGWQPVNDENERYFSFLSECPQLCTRERQLLRSRLLDHYYEADKMPQLDNRLENYGQNALEDRERNKLVHYLVSRGFYEKAFDFALDYGPDSLEPKLLVRIGTYMLEEYDKESQKLLWLMVSAFQRGKYNQSVLSFLEEQYRGSCKEMMRVFQAARDFDVEVYHLSERILTQMLFSKADVQKDEEVFKAYIAGGGKTSLEIAFLNRRSKEFLFGKKEMDDYLIRSIARAYKREEGLKVAAHLAYLKYFALYPEKREQAEKELLSCFLWEAARKREWHFPFLLEYCNSQEMEILEDRSFLFYENQAGAEVILHYQNQDAVKEGAAYCRENMDELAEGIFTKEFILFSGEELNYYITCTQGNQEELTKSGVLQAKKKDEEDSDSRYGMINRMAKCLKEKDFDRTEGLLEEYWKKGYLVQKVFLN
ncbi:MAG: DUF5717 family protein [Lachnospiraceae bacterium]